MTEQSILDRVRERAGAAGMVAGIGDDCAIFRPRPREDLVFTTDLMIEDVHFLRDDPAASVGHRTLARGLSDIAAMGAAPRFCLLSLAAPDDRRWIDRFFDGLLRLASRFHTTLAGGDLSRSNRIACDIVVCGAVPRGAAIRRDGARAGDGIYVSGPLGGSALGRTVKRGAAWRRHLMPEPRVGAGAIARGLATAAMDLSDGLSIDLPRLCNASRTGADIDRVPIHRGATLEQALHGGEDYELLVTSSKELPEGFIRIGTVSKERGIRFQGRPLPPLGWDHFRK